MSAPRSEPARRDNVAKGPWGPPGPEPSRRHSFRERFLEMLGRDDPAELVAASFAVGVFIAFTPLFGLHLVMALALAFLLKLNKLDVVLGTLVVNPLTFGPVSAVALPFGRWILKARHEAAGHLPWGDLLRKEFWQQARPAMRAIGIQWAVGMLALAVVAGALTYFVLVQLIRAHRERVAALRPAPTGRAAPEEEDLE